MTTSTNPIPSGLQIAILDRGFVYVGDVTISGDWCVIENAQNVRRWGTKRGLGELAAGGPTETSVIEPAGTVRAPLRALIGLIACEAASWKR
jgi:hypothetical protein